MAAGDESLSMVDIAALDDGWHWLVLMAIFRAQKFESLLELGVRSSILRQLCEPRVYAGVDIKDSPNVTHRMSTDAFFEEHIKDARFDMILIDADHRYEQVRKDLFSSMDHLSQSGVIACHDTMPGEDKYTGPSWCFDAYKILYESCFPEVNVLTLHRHPGLTLFVQDPIPVLEKRCKSVTLRYRGPQRSE